MSTSSYFSMVDSTSDLHVVETRPLMSPALIHRDLPLDEAASGVVSTTRNKIQSILHGNDPRILVIVGPCSVHDVDAAIEYANRLAPLREKYSQKLEIVMRVYLRSHVQLLVGKDLLMILILIILTILILV